VSKWNKKNHCQHLQADIDQFMKSTSDEMVDKQELKQKMVDILEFVADREEVMSNSCFIVSVSVSCQRSSRRSSS